MIGVWMSKEDGGRIKLDNPSRQKITSSHVLGMHSTHSYDEKFPHANQESTFLGETLNCKMETEKEGEVGELSMVSVWSGKWASAEAAGTDVLVFPGEGEGEGYVMSLLRIKV